MQFINAFGRFLFPFAADSVSIAVKAERIVSVVAKARIFNIFTPDISIHRKADIDVIWVAFVFRRRGVIGSRRDDGRRGVNGRGRRGNINGSRSRGGVQKRGRNRIISGWDDDFLTYRYIAVRGRDSVRGEKGFQGDFIFIDGDSPAGIAVLNDVFLLGWRRAGRTDRREGRDQRDFSRRFIGRGKRRRRRQGYRRGIGKLDFGDDGFDNLVFGRDRGRRGLRLWGFRGSTGGGAAVQDGEAEKDRDRGSEAAGFLFSSCHFRSFLTF